MYCLVKLWFFLEWRSKAVVCIRPKGKKKLMRCMYTHTKTANNLTQP